MINILSVDKRDRLKKFIDETTYNSAAEKKRFFCIYKEDAVFFELATEDFKSDSSSKFCVYCDSKDLTVITSKEKVHSIDSAAFDGVSPIIALCKVLYTLVEDDTDALDNIETACNDIELGIFTASKKVKDVSQRIVNIRHKVMRIKKYYDRLTLIIDSLLETKGRVATDEACEKLNLTRARLTTLLGIIGEIRELLNQIVETYHSKIELEQNSVMKFLTALTAIFLPLTLVVGWYGMNFNMPEFSWKYGYVYVILISVAVCALFFVVFKKKKWF